MAQVRRYAGGMLGGLLLTVFLLLATAAPARAARQVVSEEAAEELAAAAKEAHIPTLAVGVVDSSSVLFQEIHGDDADENTPFLLGSLSKSFTAFAVMQLVEDGKVDLDAPVTDYVHSARTNATIRQLLHHTSGLGTYDTPQDYRTDPKKVGKHEYANVNYALLGKVIEAVSGEKYAQYIETSILEPLGMEDTWAKTSDAEKNGLVRGNISLFGIPVRAFPPQSDAQSWIQPAAGYISSSLHDMETYLQMYLRGGESIASAETIQQMLNDGVEVEDEIPYRYAMGWTRVDEPLPVPVYRHAGLVETGMTCMYLIPSRDLGIVFLANVNDYLVGTDLMDRIGWNFVLRILEVEPGRISPGEYNQSHTVWNLIYLAVLATAVVPFLFIGPALRRKKGPRSRGQIWRIVLYFFAYPTALLMIVPLLAETPLWVIGAFVPDLYSILIATAALLYVGGAIRLAVPSFRNLQAGPQ